MSIENKLNILHSLYTDEVIEQLLTAAAHSAGVVAIARERLRQITAEGYDAAHDDAHPGEMTTAGAHYGFNAGHSISETYDVHERASVPARWPWGAKAWKPKTPGRDIERGGALLAAEYDSLERRSKATECDCFGDSGLHASTHVPVGDGREHCDLCGRPIQVGSVDTLTAVNRPE